jgi:hypothetical protein
MICFFAETAANTGQEKAVFHLRITFVRDVV